MDAAIRAYFIVIPIVSAENARVHALDRHALARRPPHGTQVYGYPLWWLAGTYVGSRTHENVIGSMENEKNHLACCGNQRAFLGDPCKGKKSTRTGDLLHTPWGGAAAREP
jgi:hypothetical protein